MKLIRKIGKMRDNDRESSLSLSAWILSLISVFLTTDSLIDFTCVNNNRQISLFTFSMRHATADSDICGQL